MFWFSRRELRFIVDCADSRRLLALRHGSRPRGVRVRCRSAPRLRDGTVSRVLRAEIVASCGCSPLELGDWLSQCFAGCEDVWYIDGVPARAGGRTRWSSAGSPRFSCLEGALSSFRSPGAA